MLNSVCIDETNTHGHGGEILLFPWPFIARQIQELIAKTIRLVIT